MITIRRLSQSYVLLGGGGVSGYPYNERHYRRFRNILIDLNRDLLTISEYMSEYDDYCELNDLCYFVMALEDRRFFRHCGFDFFSFIREAFKAVRNKKHGGASTIDMQLVRTITGFKDLTVYRKFYEVILAVLLNFKFSKKQIIMCYLRNAFFGSRLIGAEKAASFFNKSVCELTVDESACLAAMLLRPKPLIPSDKWFESIRVRALYAKRFRGSVKEGYY